MVAKSYLRFVEGPDSGVVSSSASNTIALLPMCKPQQQSNPARSSSNNAGSRGVGAAKSAATTATTSTADYIVIAPALEYVALWSLRTGQLLDRLCPAQMELGSTAEVTAVAAAVEDLSSTMSIAHIAVGYANGCVSYWRGLAPTTTQQQLPQQQYQRFASAAQSNNNNNNNLNYNAESGGGGNWTWHCIFYGQSHKPDTAVLSVALDVTSRGAAAASSSSTGSGGATTTSAARMLSSGQDTDITVWDLTTQEPLYRLCGHRGAVVNATFLKQSNSSGSVLNNTNLVVSGSADGLVKVWDLSVQSCVETVVASDTQVTALAVDAGGQRVFIGVRDDHIKVYAVSKISSTGGSDKSSSKNNNNDHPVLVSHGMLRRKTNKPPTSIAFSAGDGGRCMIVVTSGNVELFRVLSADEVHKKVQRKLRRRKEAEKRARGKPTGGDGGGHGDANDNDDAADEAESDANKNKKKLRRVGDETAAEDAVALSSSSTAAVASSLWQPTVNEEILPVRLFTMSSSPSDGKIRSAHVFVPAAFSFSTTTGEDGGDGEQDDAQQQRSLPLRFLISTNENGLMFLDSKREVSSASQQQQQQANTEQQPIVLSDWRKCRGGERVADIGGTHVHQQEIRRLVFDSADAQLASVSQDAVKIWFVSSAAQEHAEEKEWKVNSEAAEEGIEQQRIKPRLVCASTFPMHELYSMAATDAVAATFLIASSDASDEKGGGGGAAAAAAVAAAAASNSSSRVAAPYRACSAVFLPGDDLLAVTTMEGRILLLSVSANTVVANIPAHHGSISDFIASADGATFISCGKTDRRVTKWQLAMVSSAVASATSTSKQQQTRLVPTLEAFGEEAQLSETPLALQLSPNDQLLAVSLQDFTVHLFYTDTFKPFLTLYGHKLPATSIGFARDGQLCATVGMDKSLRFWGVDFGDCHRSIHAHDNYVNAVSFLGSTHYVATVSLDGTVKLWDGDTWTLIQQFSVHQRGLLCVATNRDGTCIATAGTDRNIRLLLRTDEMLFPEEELANAAQRAADAETAKRSAMKRLDQVEVGDVGIAGQKTVGTAEAAEHLMSALDAVSVELQRRARIAAGEVTGAPSMDMQNTDPYVYLWRALERIKPSQLRHALSSITQTHMHSLLQLLVGAVHDGAVKDYAVAARVVLALVKPAPGSNASPSLVFPDPREAHRVLSALGEQITAGVRRDTDRAAMNVAGLEFMLTRLEQQSKVTLIHDRSKVQGAARKFSSRELKAAQDNDDAAAE